MAFIEIKTDDLKLYVECLYLKINEKSVTICYKGSLENEKLFFENTSESRGHEFYFDKKTRDSLKYIKKENEKYLYKHWGYKEEKEVE